MKLILAVVIAVMSVSSFADAELWPPVNQSGVGIYRAATADKAWFDTIDAGLRSFKAQQPYRKLVLRQCGQANAFFEPSSKDLVLCYEMMQSLAMSAAQYLGRRGPDATGLAKGAVIFILFHEYGHALIRASQSPMLGREEDAADQVAAVLTRKTGFKDAILPAVMAASMKGSAFKIASRSAMADEHSLDQQRRSNVICWVMGDDQASMQAAVQAGELTPRRAQRCAEELAQAERAVNAMLQAPSW